MKAVHLIELIKMVENYDFEVYEIENEYRKRVYEMMDSGNIQPPSKVYRESIKAVLDRKRKEYENKNE